MAQLVEGYLDERETPSGRRDATELKEELASRTKWLLKLRGIFLRLAHALETAYPRTVPETDPKKLGT